MSKDFRADGQASMAELFEPGELSHEEQRLLDHPPPTTALRRAFDMPPFTVLDTRSGEWGTRKKHWLNLGIKSELGRGRETRGLLGSPGRGELPEDGAEGTDWSQRPKKRAGALDRGEGFADMMRDKSAGPGAGKSGGLLFDSLSGQVPDYYAQKRKAEAKLGRELTNEEFEADHLELPETSGLSGSGTSVFDPVLCELVYRWFSPLGGRVLDPFAGGSVRGIVAACRGLRYLGIELQERQVEANWAQWESIEVSLRSWRQDAGVVPPEWHAYDSRAFLPDRMIGPKADLVFTCPPYYDLEVYSNDPKDISALPTYGEFLEAYQDIITRAVAALAENRFAVFVVGDIRDKHGFYRGLVKDTVDALEAAGAAYYNHAVLINSVGSLPVRVPRQFRVGRKLGKTHQDVVVAFKGDPHEIRNDFPEETGSGAERDA